MSVFAFPAKTGPFTHPGEVEGWIGLDNQNGEYTVGPGLCPGDDCPGFRARNGVYYRDIMNPRTEAGILSNTAPPLCSSRPTERYIKTQWTVVSLRLHFAEYCGECSSLLNVKSFVALSYVLPVSQSR